MPDSLVSTTSPFSSLVATPSAITPGDAMPPLAAKYPANLGTAPFDKWMLFSAMTGRHVVRDQVIAAANTVDSPITSVALYIPDAALTSSLDICYDQNDLGPMVGALVELAAKGVSGVLSAKGAGGATDAIFSGLKEMTGKAIALSEGKTFADALKADAFKLTAGLAAEFGNEGDFTAGVAFGNKPNPRTDVLFDSQKYRTYELQWMLVPRNLAEARQIDIICYFFQFYGLPRYLSTQAEKDKHIGSFMMGFPYEFTISMYAAQAGGTNSDLSHINHFGRSVLTNVTIDHAAGGKTAFIKDDGEFYPVATKLTLAFQEVRLLDRNSDEIARGGRPMFQDVKS